MVQHQTVDQLAQLMEQMIQQVQKLQKERNQTPERNESNALQCWDCGDLEHMFQRCLKKTVYQGTAWATKIVPTIRCTEAPNLFSPSKRKSVDPVSKTRHSGLTRPRLKRSDQGSSSRPKVPMSRPRAIKGIVSPCQAYGERDSYCDCLKLLPDPGGSRVPTLRGWAQHLGVLELSCNQLPS